MKRATQPYEDGMDVPPSTRGGPYAPAGPLPPAQEPSLIGHVVERLAPPSERSTPHVFQNEAAHAFRKNILAIGQVR